jgi:hypothetical protein
MPRKRRPSQPLTYNIRPAPRVVPQKVKLTKRLGDLTAEERKSPDLPPGVTDKDALVQITVPLDENTWLEAGGDWVPVISTNVVAIKYDEKQLNFYIRFKNGREYVYYHIIPHIARMTFVASSMGQHVWLYRRRGLVKGRDYDQVK